MATLKFTTKIGGVVADVTSVVLADPTGVYGIKRNDTGATVVAVNTVMTNTATGTYQYDFAVPGSGVEYTFYVKWMYGGETHYVENLFTSSGDIVAVADVNLTTLRFTTKMGGVLTDVTSVNLADPTGTYGIKRDDTNATVIAVNTTMTKVATGTYEYVFAYPVGGVEYTFYVHWHYAGESHYVENVFTASGGAGTLSGLSFEELIASVLNNDARLTGSGCLGQLLNYNATSKPNVVFHDYPPKHVATPVITYSVTGETGHFPKTVFIDIKAWGNNYRAIQNRVYDLLHKKLELSATDWQIKGIAFESAGPVLYDDALKVFFQRARYWTKVLRV